MSPTGPFFLGSEISLVDLNLAPWAVRLWVLDHFKAGGFKIPVGKIWERWGEWLEAIEERESVKRTLSEREHYLPIYKRYAEYDTSVILFSVCWKFTNHRPVMKHSRNWLRLREPERECRRP